MLTGIYFEIYIISIFFFFVLSSLLIFLKIRRKLMQLEERSERMESLRAEEYLALDARLSTLKKIFIDKLNQLELQVNKLSENHNTMIEKYNSIGDELDKKVEPLQSLFDVTVSKVNSSQEALKSVIEEGENEIKRMAEGIYNFSKEISQMKDFIRERTIDLEL